MLKMEFQSEFIKSQELSANPDRAQHGMSTGLDPVLQGTVWVLVQI